jgi:DNA-binding LytR/AlgR family response regulator
MVKVLFNDILYIEGLRDYIRIFTTSKTIVTKHLLAALEEMLPSDAFYEFIVLTLYPLAK